jgi:F-box domain
MPPVDNHTPAVCLILELPIEILGIIADNLNLRDLLAWSRTCRTLHSLINDDHYWMHRIRRQYPTALARFYTWDLFQEYQQQETIDDIRPSGFEHVRVDGTIDQAAIQCATHYNDDAIDKRQAKMYVSKEEFLRKLQYFQYKMPVQHKNIPLMKFVYFYLIDRKRSAAVDMDVIHRNNHFLVETSNRNRITQCLLARNHRSFRT